ncbi:transmembrane protein [Rhodococcus wratislaviensis IFP 2016]|nr:transmembrane protein [Rhodococcus wratislaviensis IFP 2016]
MTKFQRFDVPAAALPYRKGTKPHRPDVLVPAIPDATGFSVATEWLGRLAAVIAVVLFALVVASIHKGLQVQHSARTVVDNFRLTNDFFAQRADLTAPATARKQLDELTGVLTQLNIATATDVDHLDALLPNARTLLAAGQGDTQIAGQLEGVATTLQGAAASLHQISAGANMTVSGVDNELTQAIDLVNQLNGELTRTTNKLALVPATDAFIPAPGGN